MRLKKYAVIPLAAIFLAISFSKPPHPVNAGVSPDIFVNDTININVKTNPWTKSLLIKSPDGVTKFLPGYIGKTDWLTSINAGSTGGIFNVEITSINSQNIRETSYLPLPVNWHQPTLTLSSATAIAGIGNYVTIKGSTSLNYVDAHTVRVFFDSRQLDAAIPGNTANNALIYVNSPVNLTLTTNPWVSKIMIRNSDNQVTTIYGRLGQTSWKTTINTGSIPGNQNLIVTTYNNQGFTNTEAIPLELYPLPNIDTTVKRVYINDDLTVKVSTNPYVSSITIKDPSGNIKTISGNLEKKDWQTTINAGLTPGVFNVEITVRNVYGVSETYNYPIEVLAISGDNAVNGNGRSFEPATYDNIGMDGATQWSAKFFIPKDVPPGIYRIKGVAFSTKGVASEPVYYQLRVMNIPELAYELVQ